MVEQLVDRKVQPKVDKMVYTSVKMLAIAKAASKEFEMEPLMALLLVAWTVAMSAGQ